METTMMAVVRLLTLAVAVAVPFVAASSDDLAAVRQFAERVLGKELAGQVQFDLAPDDAIVDDLHRFEYESVDDELVIRGTSIAALTSALGWYLKYDANVHISWSGDQTDPLQGSHGLPKARGRVQRRRSVPLSYYMNVCTFSYTAVWWDWPRWERELDWMALNGINAPLALTGQEYIWRRVFVERFGMTRDELDEFFTGPAFLAWHRMGNLRAWAGPLSDKWIDQQRDLQVKILGRARALGMKAILPAFAGHVPAAAKRIWPDAEIRPASPWGAFEAKYTNVYMVQPGSPVFTDIGRAFVEEISREFGTDHLYNADTYNEMRPESMDHKYLSATAASTLESMTAADPDAIWVMQGWLFVDKRTWTPGNIEAYLSGVPDDRLVVLDLFSDVVPIYDQPNGYFGKRWIYNMLHNFGGNHGLYGRADVISSEPVRALTASDGKMIGIGLTPEGIEQNYALYELMLEMAWRHEPVDLDEWFRLFAWRRYGGPAPNGHVDLAWDLIQRNAYRCSSGQWSVTKTIAGVEPRFAFAARRFMNPIPHYDPATLVEAWYELLHAAPEFAHQATFRYDLVDVTRQVLNNFMLDVHARFVDAYRAGQVERAKQAGQQFLDVITDLDRILASDSHWLLGTWLDGARRAAQGNDDVPVDKFLFNARNLITMWGPRAEIADYASKDWAGLMESYYRPRWQLFFDMAVQSLEQRTQFDRSDYLHYAYRHELNWQHASDEFPTEPTGDTVEISRHLFHKYAGAIWTHGRPLERCPVDDLCRRAPLVAVQ
ncbi:Alpha-N-acetylglucosaminidase [Plasmodiophora brassicae]|uniref:Alpha-N-acetylglucosaminidase n=1 Tax=Plasmodiophora brassicae TaxID=37360 RepID=A0A3P3Y0E7_PLABS|nr:unnamed protein product [Plasmodiophora brassicae]